MYKVELSSSPNDISDFSNAQLICSYYYLNQTFNYLYKKKLRNLSRKEKKAIIYDLSLFETIKKKKYSLKCVTPKKWLENWTVYIGITSEIRKRELLLKSLDSN